ncbi:MAG: class I SAM-dependent methyltransferase [Thermodesulfobacteriota bacterium]
MNKPDDPNNLRCPGCGVRGLNPTETYLVKYGFSIIRCRHCALRFIANRDAEKIDNLYLAFHQKGGYYDVRYNENDPRRGPTFERWLDIIERIKPTGKLLDIGAAYGEFLRRAARRERWNLSGVEIDPEAARQAGIAAKSNVRSGRIEEQTFNRHYFDIITAFELIEHLPDPRNTIMQIYEWLKPEGIFCVSTPNLNKLKNRISRRGRENFYIPPEHLLYFNRRALRILLESLGFKKLLIDAGIKSLLHKLNLYSDGKQSSVITKSLEACLRSGQWLGIEGFQIFAVFQKTRT